MTNDEIVADLKKDFVNLLDHLQKWAIIVRDQLTDIEERLTRLEKK